MIYCDECIEKFVKNPKHNNGVEFQYITKTILKNLTKYYEGWSYNTALSQYQEVSRDEFTKNQYGIRYIEPEISKNNVEKYRMLNVLIKNYKVHKSNYMGLNNRKNYGLMTFFEKSKDNLRNIMENLNDMLFYNINTSINVRKKMVALNPALNNYWTNPIIFYYIQVIELIFMSSKQNRETFYEYLTEYKDE